MSKRFTNKAFLLLAGLVVLAFFPCARARAVELKFGSKKIPIASGFQRPMQCILDKLEQGGYRPREVGCFATRPRNRSAHPSGHACDVDQTARDVTRLNGKFGRSQQISIAQGCNGVSGCKWRSSDCGHFEQRSAPYSRAGTPPGGRRYYYGQRKSFRRR